MSIAATTQLLNYADHSDRYLQALNNLYSEDETICAERLLQLTQLSPELLNKIQQLASELVTMVRQGKTGKSGIDAFLLEYHLSSKEGTALMCLAEALLRIPDAATRDKLIKDKILAASWQDHLGKSSSIFVNATTFALMFTGKVFSPAEMNANKLTITIKKLVERTGEPFIRTAVVKAMQILGKQFVLGQTIQAALTAGAKWQEQGYRYSFDMLGEAARTVADAEKYYQAYEHALQQIAAAATTKDVMLNNGISVKLSALDPRYEYTKPQRLPFIIAKVKQLALLAKAAHLGLTIDAEESHRLNISLQVLDVLARDPDLADWGGLGLAVQAYQKRGLAVLDYVINLAQASNNRLCVRLVKGAYWDSEIKSAQEQGLSGYPVFTRKETTDVSYLACATKMLAATADIFPQFATHNAYTVASILTLAKPGTAFEFQRLHGMGEALYQAAVAQWQQPGRGCRIYAPVGSHKNLLAYLVRRLLENGANSSFVNRIVDATLPIEQLVQEPRQKLLDYAQLPHPHIPLPMALFTDRLNSKGWNLANPRELVILAQAAAQAAKKVWQAKPIVDGAQLTVGKAQPVRDPSATQRIVGEVWDATAQTAKDAVQIAKQAYLVWSAIPVAQRVEPIFKFADLLEQHSGEFIYLLGREAGRTVNNAISELREAVDFCRYYATEALKLCSVQQLPGPTGEDNQLRLRGRGVMVAISPWNFPLAIFTGQIVAALVMGNTCIAKPAEQTPLIGMRAIELLLEAGIPPEVLHYLPGPGETVGAALVEHAQVAGVLFTGSFATAKIIQRSLAARPGAIVPLIAETGGMNAMIVDSSALPEQVVRDVVNSAFDSAGQRCSALRILYLQQEIADDVIAMLCGAMDVLTLGDPLDLATDIGPVIDQPAYQALQRHAEQFDQKFGCVHKVNITESGSKDYFFAPRIYEIKNIAELPGEVFGPVLHIIRYAQQDLAQVIESINNTGYGLTCGIHSRIDDTIAYVEQRLHAGNCYVNRNMIGAVVGVQPFGGEGLSGTGPKAGGPYYLLRLALERTSTVDTTATGGNASLLCLSNV